MSKASKNPELKVMLLGDSKTGKTSVFNLYLSIYLARLKTGKFNDSKLPRTAGVETGVRVYDVPLSKSREMINIRFWDTGILIHLTNLAGILYFSTLTIM